MCVVCWDDWRGDFLFRLQLTMVGLCPFLLLTIFVGFCFFVLFYFILIFIIEVKCAHTLTVQCVVVVDVVGVFSVSKPDVPNHG